MIDSTIRHFLHYLFFFFFHSFILSTHSRNLRFYAYSACTFLLLRTHFSDQRGLAAQARRIHCIVEAAVSGELYITILPSVFPPPNATFSPFALLVTFVLSPANTPRCLSPFHPPTAIRYAKHCCSEQTPSPLHSSPPPPLFISSSLTSIQTLTAQLLHPEV